MKLAFSTNAYLKFSFPEAAARLARIGYTGVEIMADVPHAWPAYLLPEQAGSEQPAIPRGEKLRSPRRGFPAAQVERSSVLSCRRAGLQTQRRGREYLRNGSS